MPRMTVWSLEELCSLQTDVLKSTKNLEQNRSWKKKARKSIGSQALGGSIQHLKFVKWLSSGLLMCGVLWKEGYQRNQCCLFCWKLNFRVINFTNYYSFVHVRNWRNDKNINSFVGNKLFLLCIFVTLLAVICNN